MIVETAYGKVKGIQENDVYVWKGIPYAAPPIGPNRFRPLTSAESWDGVKDCSEFGPSAWQPSLEIMSFLGNQTTRMSEDCLTLNIWSPGTDGKKRPVLVWIHGGAFISGPVHVRYMKVHLLLKMAILLLLPSIIGWAF